MTSQDTFEESYRQRLLDLIYGQWAALGAPFAARSAADDSTVIDPEALVWCSLEFLATEPRLAETVSEWIDDNPHYLVRQRIIRAAKSGDPRSLLWQALDRRNRHQESASSPPGQTIYGLHSHAELAKFARRIAERQPNDDRQSRRLGRARKGAATLLLRARDLLGHDIRHFLLVYLLANAQGGKLRDLQEWSGYAYRSLSEAADRWKAADIIRVEAGYCRLLAADAFQQLLHIKSQPIALVNWWAAFESSVHLLRDLEKAKTKGFGEGDAITESLKREAADKLEAASSRFGVAQSPSLHHLLTCFAVEV